jgi:5-methylcytosine-specific restriction endonuclease McrA
MKSKYTKEILKPLVEKNKSLAGVIRDLGLKPRGSNYTFIRRRINECLLDTSHFTGQGWRIGKLSYNKYDVNGFIENVLVVDGPGWTSHNIKNKLFEFGLKEKQCENCPQGSIWNGGELRFHLDHINGNHSDNQLENLKILCPNCHSQTSTYSTKKSN